MSNMVRHLGRISRIHSFLITAALLSALVPAVAIAQTAATHFKVLHPFNHRDGQQPAAGLILDSAGKLYGATAFGGVNCDDVIPACGVVFELSPTGQEKVLHKFTGPPDGSAPLSNNGGNGVLTRDAQGNLYGVTFAGGNTSNQCGNSALTGCGTVFEIDKTGKESVLYAFTGINGDGAVPIGTLIMDDSGNLYGTTLWGGSGYCGGVGCGTVFRLDTKTGIETVLYSFLGPDSEDGQLPTGLVEDAAGNFYGSTTFGGITGPPGSICGINGCGIVFKVDKTRKESVLYKFTGANGDGALPNSVPVWDKEGNLYGATCCGGKGSAPGNGIVFKVTKTGQETILHAFNGSDGLDPFGPVAFDGVGNLYAVTAYGGSSGTGCGGLGCGTVFKLAKAGKKYKETILHSFSGGKDGNLPASGLTIDGVGNLYGTAMVGGNEICPSFAYSPGCGVAFKITP